MKELQNCIENNEIVAYETDKSKKWSVNTPNNYKEDMKVHVQNDKIVTQKDINKITKQFNEASKSFVAILGIGDKIGHHSRIMNNVHVSNFSELPVKSGMYKDHKDGRKYRPYVNGNVGPISNISEID